MNITVYQKAYDIILKKQKKLNLLKSSPLKYKSSGTRISPALNIDKFTLIYKPNILPYCNLLMNVLKSHCDKLGIENRKPKIDRI